MEDKAHEVVPMVGIFDSVIVGMAIADTNVNAEMLRSNFQLEDFVYWGDHLASQHAQLQQFFLHPIFNSKRRHFLKVREAPLVLHLSGADAGASEAVSVL